MTTLAEEITSALERIPDMLNFTQGTLTIFRSSEDLHRYSSNFYVALIEALIGIMEYLKKSSIGTSPDLVNISASELCSDLNAQLALPALYLKLRVLRKA